MATLEKRGQFWRVKIRRTGLPAQTRTFDSKTDAQKWARGVESEIDKGIVVDRRVAQRLSLAEVLEKYRREVTPTKRGSADENLRLKAMAQRPFARIRMSALTSSHLAAYRDERLKVVSGATVNREFSVLSHAIDTARREWDVYLPTNPCTLVRRPPQGRPRTRRLQGDEDQRLLAACRGARNAWLPHFVALAIETGMRRSELLSLLWANVDLERRIALLPLTKNGESRGVPLSTRAVATLRGLPASSNGCVFGELTTNALKQSFKRAVRRAGISGLRFHDLRHEATSRFFERGLNVMEVASVTGHKTLQILEAVKNFAREEFGAKYRYAMVLHTDEPHPHVHLSEPNPTCWHRTRIELTYGAVITIPVKLIPHLKRAAPSDVQSVEVLGAGSGLHWRAWI